MDKKILAIGKNSMLAQWWRTSQFARSKVSFISHSDIGDDRTLDQIETVVSFCRHPDYDCALLPCNEDPNGRIAAWLVPRQTQLIILSSCKVYSPLGRAISETDPANSNSIGSRNRLQSEQIARDKLGDRLTVLRCSNVFGYEISKNRPRFMAMLLDSLKKRDIVEFNCNPDTRRDFLPDHCFVRCLEHVAGQPRPGIFNFGSGIPLTMRKIAEWVIEGYGAGHIAQTAEHSLPDVTIDITKLTRIYGAPASLSDIRQRCTTIGSLLRMH